jgi:hypothetical protein
MKTKTSLLAALVAMASSATVMAQVYSLNVVGYVNVTAPAGFSMIANQLSGTNTTIGSLIANPPPGTQIYKWDGASYLSWEYFDVLGWFPDGNATLNPGEGAFIKNPTATNLVLTFVGEVLQGSLSNSLPQGFTIRSSMVPQSGTLASGTNAPALNFPAAPGDQIYKWVPATSSYDSYEYFDVLGWFPSDPSVAVGESFFVNKSANSTWTRNFSAN